MLIVSMSGVKHGHANKATITHYTYITPDPLTGNRQLVTTENINSVYTLALYAHHLPLHVRCSMAMCTVDAHWIIQVCPLFLSRPLHMSHGLSCVRFYIRTGGEHTLDSVCTVAEREKIEVCPTY